nr:hypothetical protein [Angustibacter aerolatus]
MPRGEADAEPADRDAHGTGGHHHRAGDALGPGRRLVGPLELDVAPGLPLGVQHGLDQARPG